MTTINDINSSKQQINNSKKKSVFYIKYDQYLNLFSILKKFL